MKIHTSTTKILKDIRKIPDEETKKAEEVKLVVKTVMKYQSTLMLQNSSNKDSIKQVINSMKPEIEKVFGSTLNKEVSGLLENLAGMTDLIETNFSEIKSIIKDQHQDQMTKMKEHQEHQMISLKDHQEKMIDLVTQKYEK